MIYIIQGAPTPLLRARHSFKTHTVYNSQKNLQLVTKMQLEKQHGDKPQFKGPIHVDVTFFIPIPIKNAKKVKAGDWGLGKIDIDNCCKWILDVAQPLIISNDSMVSMLTAKKVYDLNPRTEFTIVKLT